jgi:hypothetical protein
MSIKGGSGGFCGIVIGGDRGIGNGRVIRIGGSLVHGDAHIIDHPDDVFDLFRFDNTVRQVVIDFCVGKEALLLSLCDQLLKLGLLLLLIHFYLDA